MAATSTANTFITKVVEQIVNPLILLLSAVALVVFAWGLYKLVANAGDDKGREEGRRAILWGIIGFVVIFGAYGIINLAMQTFNLAPKINGQPKGNIEGILKFQ